MIRLYIFFYFAKYYFFILLIIMRLLPEAYLQFVPWNFLTY